jgi:hypothetical protein
MILATRKNLPNYKGKQFQAACLSETRFTKGDFYD